MLPQLAAASPPILTESSGAASSASSCGAAARPMISSLCCGHAIAPGIACGARMPSRFALGNCRGGRSAERRWGFGPPAGLRVRLTRLRGAFAPGANGRSPLGAPSRRFLASDSSTEERPEPPGSGVTKPARRRRIPPRQHASHDDALGWIGRGRKWAYSSGL